MTRSLASVIIFMAPLWLLELKHALPAFPLVGAAPDPLILAAVIAGMRAAPERAALFGAVAGLLVDLPSEIPLGLGGARLSLLALAVSRARTTLALDSGGALAVVAFVVTGLFEISGALILDSFAEVDLGALAGRCVRIAIATAVVAPLAWSPAIALFQATRSSRQA
jgi:rod shape-determining protein MreD